MNSTTKLTSRPPEAAAFAPLIQLRQRIYQSFERAADALMNTLDALLTENQAQSLPELSLSPLFERRWHSLYEAFEDGRIDQEALTLSFADHAPWPTEGRVLLAVDACSIARPKAVTARDRANVHEANLPVCCPPVVPGWQFSTLALMPQTPSSWTYTLDNRRIPTHQSQAQVAAQQLRALLEKLPPEAASPWQAAQRPLLLADGYYSCLEFFKLTQGLACDKLVRLAKNRVLYRATPPPSGKRGNPRLHGAPFKCPDTTTHGEPDERFAAPGITLQRWDRLHFKEALNLPVSVIRVHRPSAAGTDRDPQVAWWVFEGEQMPPLELIPQHYACRYSIEHAFRVDKQDLLWECVRLRTPEQLERFTQVVACVRNQLCLARGLCELRQPWESPHRQASPSQVRRGMRAIMNHLGTPARRCQPRGYSPGRAKGTKGAPAIRYALVKNTVRRKRQRRF